MIVNSLIQTCETVILGPIQNGKEVASVQVFFCNTNLTQDISLNIYAVPSSQVQQSDINIIVKQFAVPMGDTLEFYQEKLILTAGDRIIQKQSIQGITQTVSYIEL